MRLAAGSIVSVSDGILAHSIVGYAADQDGTNSPKVILDIFSTNSMGKRIRNTERASRVEINRCGAKAGEVIS